MFIFNINQTRVNGIKTGLTMSFSLNCYSMCRGRVDNKAAMGICMPQVRWELSVGLIL
jgi:hypothetical protein